MMNFGNSFDNLLFIDKFELFDFLVTNFGQRFILITIEPNDSCGRVKGRIGRTDFEEFFVSVVQTQNHEDIFLNSFHERFVQVLAVILTH